MDAYIQVGTDGHNDAHRKAAKRAGLGDRVLGKLRDEKDGVEGLWTTDPEGVGMYLRYGPRIDALRRQQKGDEAIGALLGKYGTVEWKDWQQELIDELKTEPDDRKVIWYVDEKGNTGKTFLSKYLVASEGAMRLENGKSADLKYAYDGQKICVIDYSRACEERVNYEVIESIKNGIYLSTKYESKMKLFDIPHVVVFANWGPDESKMSEDRWDIRYIN